jgi:hypothetical protein
MPEPTVGAVTAQLRRAADAQLAVVDAARKAAEAAKVPPAPATPPSPAPGAPARR